MGRAKGHSSAGNEKGFAQLFGTRRGLLSDADGLDADNPSSAARGAAERLRAGLVAGELTPFLDELERHRSHLADRPLLKELTYALAVRLVDDEVAVREDTYRAFANVTSVRTYWANQLVRNLQDAVIHIWPDGENHGERNLNSQFVASISVVTACGQTLAADQVSRHIPRGAWQQPAFSNDGGPWQYTRCRECEAHASGVQDCAEQPRTYHLLSPADTDAFRQQAAAAVSARVASRLRSVSLPDVMTRLRHDAEVAVRDSLTDAIAARMAADGDLALARLNGYRSSYKRLPDETQWRQLLNEFRPTRANARRYEQLSKGASGNLSERLKTEVKRLLVDLNPRLQHRTTAGS